MRQLAFRVSDALSETGTAAGLQTRLSFRAQARVLIRLFRVFRGKDLSRHFVCFAGKSAATYWVRVKSSSPGCGRRLSARRLRLQQQEFPAPEVELRGREFNAEAVVRQGVAVAFG